MKKAPLEKTLMKKESSTKIEAAMAKIKEKGASTDKGVCKDVNRQRYQQRWRR
jgi:hypothetical protein